MYPAKRLGMGAVVALVLAACGGGPADSQPPRDVANVAEPAGGLMHVSPQPFPYHALGSFAVNASADSATAYGGEVRIRVRTSGGDEEQIDMAVQTGTLPRQLLVSMRDGHHLAELRARMNPEQLRFGSFGITGSTGLLHVVSGDPAAALSRVRGWPEVRSVSPNAMAHVGMVGGRGMLSMGGALPMDEAASTPRNGTLELRPGETATVEFRTPEGAASAMEYTFQSQSEPDIRAFVPVLVREVERVLYADSAARPPLLIDAESFAQAAWSASGTRVTAAEAVAGLPAGYTVVSGTRGDRCRGSVVPRDCSDVAQGTFLYTTGMFRSAGRYELMANFRAPGTPAACVRQQSFRFEWINGEWRATSNAPDNGC